MSEETDLFTRLGGTRAIAERMSEAPSTVQSWKSARRIPAHKQADFIGKHAEAGFDVTAEEVIWPFGRPMSSGKSEDLTAAQQSEAA
ncbi:carph-isopro domain-containing protein [Sphingobium sp. YG1]|uniref:carph-isopro domain-containing protein n=1 Tax=Sphingobium sp. YG1 TaxID=2082188 RepID=UPI0011AEBA82|nr:hypothetical protein [Sphingobium sp. YG1]